MSRVCDSVSGVDGMSSLIEALKELKAAKDAGLMDDAEFADAKKEVVAKFAAASAAKAGTVTAATKSAAAPPPSTAAAVSPSTTAAVTAKQQAVGSSPPPPSQTAAAASIAFNPNESLEQRAARLLQEVNDTKAALQKSMADPAKAATETPALTARLRALWDALKATNVEIAAKSAAATVTSNTAVAAAQKAAAKQKAEASAQDDEEAAERADAAKRQLAMQKQLEALKQQLAAQTVAATQKATVASSSSAATLKAVEAERDKLKRDAAEAKNAAMNKAQGYADTKAATRKKYYTEVAGIASVSTLGIKGLTLDAHANASGGQYDLGRDGAFGEFTILIGNFSAGQCELSQPLAALKVKGFQTEVTTDEGVFLSKLPSASIAWVISGSSPPTRADFASAVQNFHMAGKGLFLFGDNVPWFSHANAILKQFYPNCQLEGDYLGQKTLKLKMQGTPGAGEFTTHDITTGIESLYEGVTICAPNNIPEAMTCVGYATDGRPSLMVSKSRTGRVVVDCGFTKLYINWDTAGTARYVVNVSVWLLGLNV